MYKGQVLNLTRLLFNNEECTVGSLAPTGYISHTGKYVNDSVSFQCVDSLSHTTHIKMGINYV